MTKCPLAQHGRGLSYWELLVKKTDGAILTDNLQDRYDIYNNIFEVEHG